MRHILFNSLLLGLDDLLTKRLDALQCFPSGAANVKLLTIQRDKIAALPASVVQRPLADALGTTDIRHDGFGGAMWFFLEAYLRHPNTPPSTIEAAKRIRAAIIPALEDLKATFAVEAKAAKDHAATLPSLKADLDLFPVAGGTLYDWAESFAAEGLRLDALLSQRADQKDRKLAGQLRVEALATLNRLRKSLAAEKKHDPTLPEDIEVQVFAYFDLLEAQATTAFAEEQRRAKAAKAAEEASSSSTSTVAVTPEPPASPATPKAAETVK